MLETAERLVTEEKEPAVQQFLLLVGGLRAMARRRARRPARCSTPTCCARSSVAGYAPSFDHCVACGVEGPHRYFNPSAGGVLCRLCKLPGSATPGAGDRRAARGAAHRRLAGRRTPPSRATSREASTLVAAYLSWHLERGLRSMAYVER